jgi:hypothetical protein
VAIENLPRAELRWWPWQRQALRRRPGQRRRDRAGLARRLRGPDALDQLDHLSKSDMRHHPSRVGMWHNQILSRVTRVPKTAPSTLRPGSAAPSAGCAACPTTAASAWSTRAIRPRDRTGGCACLRATSVYNYWRRNGMGVALVRARRACRRSRCTSSKPKHDRPTLLIGFVGSSITSGADCQPRNLVANIDRLATMVESEEYQTRSRVARAHTPR